MSGESGSESLAVAGVTQAMRDLHLPSTQLEWLKVIVAEATLNAMRRCSTLNQPGAQVSIRVLASRAHADSQLGWGFLLIEGVTNDARTRQDRTGRLIEVFLYLEGDRRHD